MSMDMKLTKKHVSYHPDVMVPVCESCLKGEHLSYGTDHREGLEINRGDCKNSQGNSQCCCGMGGYVYNPLTDRLEEEVK